jgi:molecular chaperone IbpA
MTNFDVKLLNRALVGFDDFFHTFETRHANQLNTNYPPYNVIKFGENDYIVEMAVAGFKRDEITVELENDVLSIRGVKQDQKTDTTQYIYHGLGARAFQRQFTLHADLIVKDAHLEDGILKVLIIHVVPENKKPKQIKIN